jgi:Protein of unknown function (DUF3011)/Peptidase inhibitor family I36
MTLRLLSRSVVLVLLFAAMAVAASAQQSIKCESNNGGRNYCGSYATNQVTLQRQISGSPCVRGSTWGVDNRGLWVDRGCRAMFSVSSYNGRPGGGYPPPPGGGYPPNQGGGEWNHSRPGDPWPPSGNWNGGNWGRGGACFYKDSNFRGDYICLRRGENRPTIGMNDRISSIRVFGGARVTFWVDSNYNGSRANTSNDVANLSNWRVPGMNHSWNDRISSIRVQ